jgi:hypothetical protein
MSMTVEQALASLKMVQAMYPEITMLPEITSAISAHIEREVDEAMVERAARAYNMFFFTSPATHDQAMKAALVAALGDSHDRPR